AGPWQHASIPPSLGRSYPCSGGPPAIDLPVATGFDRVPIPSPARGSAMTDSNPDNKWIGKRTPRPDGADKVTGRAAYAADPTMPGMIWGKVLRSPHPHARIRSIDTSKAEKLPGVKAVVTSKDIVDFPIAKGPVMLGIQDMRWMCRNVMARERALFHGHPVAAVAADTQAIAAEACKLIKVDFEVLPFVIDVDDARKAGAPTLFDHIKFDGKPSNI